MKKIVTEDKFGFPKEHLAETAEADPVTEAAPSGELISVDKKLLDELLDSIDELFGTTDFHTDDYEHLDPTTLEGLSKFQTAVNSFLKGMGQQKKYTFKFKQ